MEEEKSLISRLNKIKLNLKVYSKSINLFTYFIKILFLLIILVIIRNNELLLKTCGQTLPLKKKISIVFLSEKFKNGGIERVASVLTSELAKTEKFHVFLLTGEKEDGEYPLDKRVYRLKCYENNDINKLLFENLMKNYNFDILIYNRYYEEQINFLLSFNKKLIIIFHQFYFFYLYFPYDFSKFYIFRKSDLFLNLIPDDVYIWRRRGIKNVMYLPNLLPFEIENIQPSDLLTKNILLVGRGGDPLKSFDLGIKAMKLIVERVPDAKLLILSEFEGIMDTLVNLSKTLNLEKNVEFLGYISNPEVFYSNSSVFFLPSISEAFPMALIEAKAFGIPNIITGKKYLSVSKKGSIIVEDEDIEGMAKETIKILLNETYRKIQGKIARDSLKEFKNEYTIKKWIKIIESVYNGKKSISELIKSEKSLLDEKKSIKILRHEFYLAKKRNPAKLFCKKFEDTLFGLRKKNFNFCN